MNRAVPSLPEGSLEITRPVFLRLISILLIYRNVKVYFVFQIFFQQLSPFLNPTFSLIFYALMFSYRLFVIENVILVLNSKLKILSTY